MGKNVETHQFQAETKRLLDLMINSIYSNKEIFLRELISNASDAIDKLRFEAITNPGLIKKDEELLIRIETDEKSRTFTIHDNGIGMTRQDVISHIGTIAKSGTKEMLENSKNKDVKELGDMIGQFGVGFYSAFMVSDRIELLTRRAGEDTATKWVSSGDGEYTIIDSERDTHGTTITLHLKPEDKENGIDDFSQYYVVSSIVKKHSDFINYPIKMQREVDKPELDKDGKPIEGKTVKEIEDNTLNSMKPIWQRSKSDVKPEEYAEFYKHISHDWQEPLETMQLQVEGRLEYRALMFIPSKAPFDLYYRDASVGLQLYTKRVLIMDACKDLLPVYLRFIKGVVESADIPLNISRELLQQDRHITAIRKRLVKKVLDSLKTMSEKDNEKYLKFWAEFGPALKEGLSSDFENQEALMGLLLFQSSNDEKKLTNLKDYISRMKKDQEAIYFITGESRALVENSPHLESFKAKGFEVLFLTDPVDELVAQSLNEFEKKPFKSVTKADLDISGDENKEEKEKELKAEQEKSKNLLEFIQKHLDADVKEVKVSSRLVSSPACIVAGEADISAHLEKLLNKSGQEVPKNKKILEVNTKHEILKKMNERFEKNKDDATLKDMAELLFGYALIAEGAEIPNPSRFNELMAKMMQQAIT